MKKIQLLLLLFTAIFNYTFSQTVSTLVPGPSTFNDGLTIDKQGNIYASLYLGETVTKITPSGLTSIFATGFSSPNGLSFGPDGLLYVSSATGNKIQRVNLNGVVEDFINVEAPSGLYFDSDGLLYVTDNWSSKIHTVDKDKNITTVFSGGKLNGPIGILKNNQGNLYIGNFTDGKIYKISADSVFEEIADLPGWVGFMTLVDSYIYATDYKNNKIYKVAIDGSGQSVFAGTGAKGNKDGNALEATFNAPNGIVASITGDTLYVSEYKNASLRMITGVKKTTTGVNEVASVPVILSLEQNYPNPFNPSTNIKYSLPESAFVNLTVYNLLGEVISTLVNSYKSKGNYEFNFNASGLTSGIYVYRLNTEGIALSRKMVILK